MRDAAKPPPSITFRPTRQTDTIVSAECTSAQCYHEQWEVAPSTFWQRHTANYRPIEKQHSAPLTSLDQHVRVSHRATFTPVATVTDKYVVETNGVVLDREFYGLLGNLSISALLSKTSRPILARDLVQYWSAEMPAPSALEVLEWAWARGLVETAK